MKTIIKSIAISTSLGLAIGMVQAQDANTNSTASSAMQTPITASDFAWDASVANLKEVRLSELAEEKSTNEDVKLFARHMIHDHLAANKKLTKMAQTDGFNLPDTNAFYITVSADNQPEKEATQLTERETPDEFLKEQQLSAQHVAAFNGSDFDQAFADTMVKDHVAAIQLFENASDNVTNEDLKHFASKTLPVLHHHYEMAQRLQNRLNMGTNAPADQQNNAAPMMPPSGN